MEKSSYTDDDIKLLIKKEVQKYFDLQAEDIMKTFRRFAYHDPYISGFLDSISSSLIRDMDSKYKDCKNNIADEVDKAIGDGKKQLDQAIKKRVDAVIAKEPFDTISREFLVSLEKKVSSKYDKKYIDKMEELNSTVSFLMFLVCTLIALASYVAYHQWKS